MDQIYLGLKPVPESIYTEAERLNHRDTIRRLSISSVQDEINTLKRVVPTAAAIAIATVNSPEVAAQLKKHDGPPVHKDVSELVQKKSESSNPSASNSPWP